MYSTQLTHFFGLSLLYLQYLHTYFFFFLFYLSSVVEVKGKRERLLFVKLLQSYLPLATAMSSTVRPCLHFLYWRARRRAIVVGSRPTVSRGAMNTNKTHTAVTCTTTKTLQNTKNLWYNSQPCLPKHQSWKNPPKSLLHTTIDQIPVYYRNQSTRETGLSYSYVSIIVSDFCWPKENIYAKKKLY